MEVLFNLWDLKVNKLLGECLYLLYCDSVLLHNYVCVTNFLSYSCEIASWFDKPSHKINDLRTLMTLSLSCTIIYTPYIAVYHQSTSVMIKLFAHDYIIEIKLSLDYNWLRNYIDQAIRDVVASSWKSQFCRWKIFSWIQYF